VNFLNAAPHPKHKKKKTKQLQSKRRKQQIVNFLNAAPHPKHILHTVKNSHANTLVSEYNFWF
jgi:hypothetical protein